MTLRDAAQAVVDSTDGCTYSIDDELEQVPMGKMYGLRLALAEDEWISVDERLPEDDTPVMVWDVFTQKPQLATFYQFDDGYHDFSAEHALNPSHWRPLPEPPER
jgi:hypothetical protein